MSITINIKAIFHEKIIVNLAFETLNSCFRFTGSQSQTKCFNITNILTAIKQDDVPRINASFSDTGTSITLQPRQPENMCIFSCIVY